MTTYTDQQLARIIAAHGIETRRTLKGLEALDSLYTIDGHSLERWVVVSGWDRTRLNYWLGY